MNKKELRKAALVHRQQYSEQDCLWMSQKITSAFLESSLFHFDLVNYLHIFLPIEHKKEVNTYPLLDQLRVRYPNIKIVLSKCDFDTSTLSHFVFSKEMELKKNKYGIPEPVSGEEITADRMDLVVVPLLLVDKHGNRIGYGKGFYDRFLAECRPDCKKIGFSFEKPIETISAESFDIPLDFCITPSEIIIF